MSGFKNVKILKICPKMRVKNFTKEVKSKIGARFEPVTHRLLAYPSTDWATSKISKFSTNKAYK